MNAPPRNRIGPSGFGKRRFNLDSLAGMLIALAMVGIIGILDVLTGYEVRLAIFYMLPIALATWTGGMRSGMLVSLAAAAFWGIGFESERFYSQKIFYYWAPRLISF